METRLIVATALTATLLQLTGGAPALAQTNVDSLRELLREQATERVEQGRTANIEEFVTREAERAVGRARREGRSSNVQIRRGDTSGVDQEQVGEGNLQSINVGSGN